MTVVWMAVLALGAGTVWGLGTAQWYMVPAGALAVFLGELVLAAAVLLLSCKAVNLEKPQNKDSRYFRCLTYAWLDIAVFLLQIRPRITGREKLPKDGRFLLVCNHIHDLDPVMLLYAFKRGRLAFISKRENRDMFVVGKLMHKISCQMINRENDREALKTILQCIAMLKQQRCSVGVFPEGYTSPDGLLHPFRSGVFKIALKAKVPVVVCTMQNTPQVLKNAKHLKPTEVHLHLVDVISPEDFAGLTAVELGSRVHALMAADLGPDRVLAETT